MHDAVQNGIGDGLFTNDFMPIAHRQRPDSMSVLKARCMPRSFMALGFSSVVAFMLCLFLWFFVNDY